jgi:hypothetical protein
LQRLELCRTTPSHSCSRRRHPPRHLQFENVHAQHSIAALLSLALRQSGKEKNNPIALSIQRIVQTRGPALSLATASLDSSSPTAFPADQPSSITSSALSSFTVSNSFRIFVILLGDTSRATANVCADLTLSPMSRYSLASWKTTFDSSGDVSRSASRSCAASCVQFSRAKHHKSRSINTRFSVLRKKVITNLISLHGDKHFRSMITHKGIVLR